MSKMRKPNQAETQALIEGDAAARAGKTVEDCPYRDAIGLRLMWVTGHQNAMSDIESARKRQQEKEDKKKLEAFPSLLAERDALLAALDEAQKDARRLDFIEQKILEITTRSTSEDDYVWEVAEFHMALPSRRVIAVASDMRKAIDAAIAAQEGGKDG